VAPAERTQDDVERLHAELLRIGEDANGVRQLLAEACPSDNAVLALLRRAVPRAFLEQVAKTEPWADRPLLLTAVVMNPRADKALSLRLLSLLPWRSLASVAATPWISSPIRMRAEALLDVLLPDLRLGERIALARIATRPVLLKLVVDVDPKVVEAGLLNPRLSAEDLLNGIRREQPSRVLLGEAAASPRWMEVYAVRLALALQPLTPLALALAQITALNPRDLERVAATEALVPLVRAAAQRVLEGRRRPRG
jgi:hypothetical protein